MEFLNDVHDPLDLSSCLRKFEDPRKYIPTDFSESKRVVMPTFARSLEPLVICRAKEPTRRLKKLIKTQTNSPATAVWVGKCAKGFQKLGLTFCPIHIKDCIHRALHPHDQFILINPTKFNTSSYIFVTAVLEYLTYELVQAAGNDAKDHGAKIIRPANITRAIKYDADFLTLVKRTLLHDLRRDVYAGIEPHRGRTSVGYLLKRRVRAGPRAKNIKRRYIHPPRIQKDHTMNTWLEDLKRIEDRAEHMRKYINGLN